MERITLELHPDVVNRMQDISSSYNGNVSQVVSDVLSDMCMGEMSIPEIANEMKVSNQVVRQNWKKWGLRLIGRGPHGRLRISKASWMELQLRIKNAK